MTISFKIFGLFLASVLIMLAIIASAAWFAGRTDLRERKELKARTEQIDLALRQMR